MSKSGKTKYRWYDEEEDLTAIKSKGRRDKRRDEKKLKNAMRQKNIDAMTNLDSDWLED